MDPLLRILMDSGFDGFADFNKWSRLMIALQGQDEYHEWRENDGTKRGLLESMQAVTNVGFQELAVRAAGEARKSRRWLPVKCDPLHVGYTDVERESMLEMRCGHRGDPIFREADFVLNPSFVGPS